LLKNLELSLSEDEIFIKTTELSHHDFQFAGWVKKLPNIREYYRELSDCISKSEE